MSDKSSARSVNANSDVASKQRHPTPPSALSYIFRKIVKLFFSLIGLAFAGALIVFLLVGLALALAYPNLPALEVLTDYRPKVPLRVYTADGVLMGEFGEERRNLVRIREVPDILKSAILAAEDDRFYQHGGVDYMGVLRAGLTNLTTGGKTQGASTITMQVARNFFLSSEKSWMRKIYEVLLSFKIEANLSKDQILELYINQIYLGQRAYGFSAAAQIYYGKQLNQLNASEAAMLAGLPKAPSAYNPVVNPKRARIRQQYVLGRMLTLGYLTEDEYRQALTAPGRVRTLGSEFNVHADYAAELARQLIYETYKEETYTRGLNAYTTIRSTDQEAAYRALRNGILDYERRHGWHGPEGFINLPDQVEPGNEAVEDELIDHPDSDNLLAAVVLSADARKVKVMRAGGEMIDITAEGLKFAQAGLSDKAQPTKRIRRGAVVRIIKNEKGIWEILQMPEVESAFIAAQHDSGAITAMVGGFDFQRNKFNHATQAWRQPGSSFKPFIYSAALEKGFTPTTTVNDAPFSLSAAQTGGQAWEPKNYDGKYEGPMRLRQALAKSKNMVSIRILQSIGPQYAQDYVTRFGFQAERHPAYLTMALGAGSVTPMQMLGAFAVFANGGHRINPYLIDRVTDNSGQLLMLAKPVSAQDETTRVIDARNAFMMDSLLRDVVRFGTGARAMSLKRNDLAGKTGTTNESKDAWFAGYSSNLVGIAWLGFDQPRSLGDRETGGGGALPIWMDYMAVAMKGVPEREVSVPEGVVNVNGDFYYKEFQPGNSVPAIKDPTEGNETAPSPTEANKNAAPAVAPKIF